MRNGPAIQLRVTFFLVFMLMFGLLGSWEGPKTVELIFGGDRGKVIEATPIYWLCVFGFAMINSLIMMFVIRKDLD